MVMRDVSKHGDPTLQATALLVLIGYVRLWCARECNAGDRAGAQ